MEKTKQDQEGGQRIVHSGDVDLSVRSYGEPHKPTLILVHGYPDSSEVWNPIVDILKHNFHVVTYDVRGCGESTEPAWMWDYSLAKLSEDLQAVMRAVCPVQPVHIIAHDWGSIQSWESVTNHRLKARIASYTTISGPCLDHASQWIRNGLASGKGAQISEVMGQIFHSWYIAAFQLPLLGPTAWRLGLSKAWPKLLNKMEKVDLPVNPTQTRDGVNGVNLYRANFLPRLTAPRQRHTEVPVQLIVPLQDSFVTPQLTECCYPYVDQLWRREVDAGHWMVQSHAEYLANCIAEFVEYCETGRETPSLAKARVNLEAFKETAVS